jgi:hypothetical protein
MYTLLFLALLHTEGWLGMWRRHHPGWEPM